MPYDEVMPKWKAGKLHSGSKKGPVVKDKSQAVAIMLSEKKKHDEGVKGYAKGGWIGKARERMEEKGTVGSLRAATRTPKGENIPTKTEERLAKSGSPAMRKKAQFALNVKK